MWRSSLKNTIYDVLKARDGWREAQEGADWEFFWADKGCAYAPRATARADWTAICKS